MAKQDLEKITRRYFLGDLKNIGVVVSGVSLGLSSGGFITGCSQSSDYTGFEQHPVDEVIKSPHTNNCYTVLYTNKEGLVQEKDYYGRMYDTGDPVSKGIIDKVPPHIKEKFKYLTEENIKKGVIVIKDLEPYKRGYINIIEYDQQLGWARKWLNYAEIHIPKNQKIE